MLHLIIGGAGCGKSTRLIGQIRKAYEQGERIYALVPEQYSFTNDLKLYEALGPAAFNAIQSLSFTSLARALFQQYGGRSGEYADDLTKTILLYQSIRALSDSSAFSHFDRQAKKPAFQDAAAKAITELRRGSISPEALLEQTARLEGRLRDKAADLAVLYGDYDRRLREKGYKDSLTDITEAAALCAGNEHFKGALLFLDEFESFTGDQMEFLDVLFAQAKELWITLRTEDPEAPAYSVFDATNATYRRLLALAQKHRTRHEILLCKEPFRFRYPDLAHVSRSILRPVHTQLPTAEHIHVFEAKNCYTEADCACAHIRKLVREQGVRYADIAIVTHQLEEYAGILESACIRYSIPFHLDRKISCMHTALLQLMSGVLELISEKRPRTEALLRYAKTRLLGISCERTARLESYCYTWNVDGMMWLEPFTAGLEENSDLEALRRELVEPIMQLREACRGQNVRTLCKELYQFLCRMNVPRNISGIAQDYQEAGCTAEASALKALWGSLADVLDALCSVLGDAVLPTSRFRDLMQALLSRISYSTPPQSLDAVLVASAETARLNAPKYVFVLGVSEGFFPSQVHSTGLFTDADKQQLEARELFLSRSTEQLIGDERLIAYKTLSSASDGLYLFYPLSDAAGSSRSPSALIRQIRDMFDAPMLRIAEQEDPCMYAATPRAAYDLTVQGFYRHTTEGASIQEALKSDPVYGPRLASLDTLALTPEHRIAHTERIRELFGDRLYLSATRLETYNLCPFQYYMNYGLGIQADQKKEINPLETGNLVHYCLEQLLTGCPDKESFDALTEAEVTARVEQYAAQYLEQAMGGSFGKDARFASNYRRITGSIPPLIQHLQQELSQSAFRPVSMELKLSRQDGSIPVTLTTPSGIQLILGGKIDRVDLYEENGTRYIRVIDYKTGKKEFDLGKLLYGVDMQMLLYLFSITEPEGKYGGAVPAGVLYVPAGGLPCGRSRSQENARLEDYINQQYLMNGVMLKERSVLTAMEEHLAGIYIPATLAKDDPGEGEPKLKSVSSSAYLTRGQFANLRTHARQVLTDMAEQLYGGRIPADPLVIGQKAPCAYCDCKEICGNVPNVTCRTYEKTAKEQMLERISGEEKEESEHA